MSMCSQNISQGAKKGTNWGIDETKTILEICLDKQIGLLMDGKKYKHMDIFRSLENVMESRGYIKTAAQMKLKLKNLRQSYIKNKRENKVSGAGTTTIIFQKQLDLMNGSRPTAKALSSDNGIDTAGLDESQDTETMHQVDDDEEEEDDENSPPAVLPKKRKRMKASSSGRGSYEKLLKDVNSKWVCAQTSMLKELMDHQAKSQSEMMDHQAESQAEMMAVEMEKQRKWEEEILKEERSFQRNEREAQMQMLLHGSKEIQKPTVSQKIPLQYMKMKLHPGLLAATTSTITSGGKSEPPKTNLVQGNK